MKAFRILSLVAISLALLFTSCGTETDKSVRDKAVIDTYVAMNNSPESQKAVAQSGIYDGFRAYRDSFNIVLEFTFIPAVDILNCSAEDFLKEMETAIIPVKNEYKTNELTKQVFDAMNANGGKLIYDYRDHNGRNITIEIEPSEIAGETGSQNSSN